MLEETQTYKQPIMHTAQPKYNIKKFRELKLPNFLEQVLECYQNEFEHKLSCSFRSSL